MDVPSQIRLLITVTVADLRDGVDLAPRAAAMAARIMAASRQV
jgi:hypothetical protein